MGREKTRIGHCINGCNKDIHARNWCRACYRRVHYEERERAKRGAIKRIDWAIGAIRIDKTGYARIKIGTGRGPKDWVKHHRFVAEKKLGRKLLSCENIHHKNGVKHDNRWGNLELWIRKQPAGQRPKDLVKFAKWILKTYQK